MVIIEAMNPTGTKGGTAAADAEVAFVAGEIEIMAIGAIVCGLVAMKLGAVFIEPVLTQDMVDALTVTIVTYGWLVTVGSI